jgi:tetratricopeptide (TPR) repeat protein
MDQAADLAFTRASILLEAGRLAEAGAAFREIVKQNAAGPKAAEANLLYAWCAGRVYEKSRSAGDGEKFASALVEHRNAFGKHQTAADATAMLAEYEERRGNFAGALKLYLEIPPQHARGDESKAAVARCYEQILAALEQQNKPRDAVESEAIARVDQFVANFPTAPEALNVHQAEVALRLARMRMNQSRPDYARADRLLERALASAPAEKREPNAKPAESSEAWTAIVATSARLRIVSLAAQNRMQEAQEFVQRLSTASVGEVLGVLDGLADAATRVDPVARRGLGELQLKAAEEIADKRASLGPADAIRLNRCLAEAYLATGQPTKAIEAYESLLKSGQRTRTMLRTVANLLLQCGTDACLTRALGYFRQIEAQEKKGSPEWLRASYDIALCCFKLKQFDESRKIVRVTRVLYPELGGGDLKKKFEQLERDLQSAAQK